MQPIAPLLASALLLVTHLATAHSPLESTHPMDGATLDAVPEMLHLTFARPARVTKLVMVHTDASGATETRLDVPSRDALRELHLTPVFPGAGHYSIDWRVLGEDGHVMNGAFSFDVR